MYWDLSGNTRIVSRLKIIKVQMSYLCFNEIKLFSGLPSGDLGELKVSSDPRLTDSCLLKNNHFVLNFWSSWVFSRTQNCFDYLNIIQDKVKTGIVVAIKLLRVFLFSIQTHDLPTQIIRYGHQSSFRHFCISLTNQGAPNW